MHRDRHFFLSTILRRLAIPIWSCQDRPNRRSLHIQARPKVRLTERGGALSTGALVGLVLGVCERRGGRLGALRMQQSMSAVQLRAAILAPSQCRRRHRGHLRKAKLRYSILSPAVRYQSRFQSRYTWSSSLCPLLSSTCRPLVQMMLKRTRCFAR